MAISFNTEHHSSAQPIIKAGTAAASALVITVDREPTAADAAGPRLSLVLMPNLHIYPNISKTLCCLLSLCTTLQGNTVTSTLNSRYGPSRGPFLHCFRVSNVRIILKTQKLLQTHVPLIIFTITSRMFSFMNEAYNYSII